MWPDGRAWVTTKTTPTIARASPAVRSLLSRPNLMGTDFSPLMAHKNETVWLERYTGHRGGWPSIIVRAGSSDLCWSYHPKSKSILRTRQPRCGSIATWTPPSAPLPSTRSHETWEVPTARDRCLARLPLEPPSGKSSTAARRRTEDVSLVVAFHREGALIDAFSEVHVGPLRSLRGGSRPAGNPSGLAAHRRAGFLSSFGVLLPRPARSGASSPLGVVHLAHVALHGRRRRPAPPGESSRRPHLTAWFRAAEHTA